MLHFSSFNTRWLRKFDIEGKKCWFLSEAKFLTIYIYIYIADMPDVFDTTIYIYIYIVVYMCMYIYVCIYVHICVYICMNIYVYIYTHKYTHTHTYMCVCIISTSLYSYVLSTVLRKSNFTLYMYI